MQSMLEGSSTKVHRRQIHGRALTRDPGGGGDKHCSPYQSWEIREQEPKGDGPVKPKQGDLSKRPDVEIVLEQGRLWIPHYGACLA